MTAVPFIKIEPRTFLELQPNRKTRFNFEISNAETLKNTIFLGEGNSPSSKQSLKLDPFFSPLAFLAHNG